jgi:hypothetical protein
MLCQTNDTMITIRDSEVNARGIRRRWVEMVVVEGGRVGVDHALRWGGVARCSERARGPMKINKIKEKEKITFALRNKGHTPISAWG